LHFGGKGKAGGTSRLAKELGTTPRTVQRYITAGAEKRKPSKAIQQRLNEIAKAQGMKPPITAAKIELDGTIAVNGKGKSYERQRQIDLEIAEDDWERLQDYAREGDEGAAWDLLAASYGVDSMELITGNISIS
jgi:hypothetical protein